MDISVLEIAPQTVAVLTFLVIAGVKLIDQLFDRDWKGSAKIITAALIGGVVSYGVDGLTVLAGLSLGLAGSGLITTVGFFGKKAGTAAPELG
jgi:hypothetical protein